MCCYSNIIDVYVINAGSEMLGVLVSIKFGKMALHWY